jgi:hypothetical protein
LLRPVRKFVFRRVRELWLEVDLTFVAYDSDNCRQSQEWENAHQGSYAT